MHNIANVKKIRFRRSWIRRMVAIDSNIRPTSSAADHAPQAVNVATPKDESTQGLGPGREDHAPAASAAPTTTALPPAASILVTADFVNLLALIVSLMPMSPFPSTLMPSRSSLRMMPAA